MSLKFIVNRTSARNSEEPPCEGAVAEQRPYVDIRSVDSPEKLTYPHDAAQDWYKRGSNHRVIDGCIVRDLEAHQVWTIELADLSALSNFCKIYGPIVIEQDVTGALLLEIYDDYRE